MVMTGAARHVQRLGMHGAACLPAACSAANRARAPTLAALMAMSLGSPSAGAASSCSRSDSRSSCHG